MVGVKKENKDKIMDMINKAGSTEYETSWDEKGIPQYKKKSNVKRGKNSRAAGGRFELKVRKDLEADGWILDKWNNNVDLDSDNDSSEPKLMIAKKKFNPFSKIMTIGTGFPDFIAFKQISNGKYNIIGVEVKMNGILSKIEKEKCRWYLKNNIFSKILIAKAIREGRNINIEYIDFKERYEK